MQHKMNLWHGPFCSIQSGSKDVELRLYDEKRRAIRPGDTIVFTDADTGDCLQAAVLRTVVFENFAQLYEAYDKIRMGYGPEETADPKDMEAYYPLEKQKCYGVMAIEIEVRK